MRVFRPELQRNARSHFGAWVRKTCRRLLSRPIWRHARALHGPPGMKTTPPWLRGQGRGWVTAEYGMLPRSDT